MHLLAWSGARIGELAILRVGGLDLDPDAPSVLISERVYLINGVYDVNTPKSAAGRRRIALPPHLVPPVHQATALPSGQGHREGRCVSTTSSRSRRQRNKATHRVAFNTIVTVNDAMPPPHHQIRRRSTTRRRSGSKPGRLEVADGSIDDAGSGAVHPRDDGPRPEHRERDVGTGHLGWSTRAEARAYDLGWPHMTAASAVQHHRRVAPQ